MNYPGKYPAMQQLAEVWLIKSVHLHAVFLDVWYLYNGRCHQKLTGCDCWSRYVSWLVFLVSTRPCGIESRICLIFLALLCVFDEQHSQYFKRAGILAQQQYISGWVQTSGVFIDFSFTHTMPLQSADVLQKCGYQHNIVARSLNIQSWSYAFLLLLTWLTCTACELVLSTRPVLGDQHGRLSITSLSRGAGVLTF